MLYALLQNAINPGLSEYLPQVREKPEKQQGAVTKSNRKQPEKTEMETVN